MLRCAACGLICTSSAKAAPYCTRFDATSRTISAATKATALGAPAQAASATAASNEPAVMIFPAPKPSIQRPSQGAVRPPISKAAESAPKIHSVGHPKSLAMSAARMLKL